MLSHYLSTDVVYEFAVLYPGDHLVEPAGIFEVRVPDYGRYLEEAYLLLSDALYYGLDELRYHAVLLVVWNEVPHLLDVALALNLNRLFDQ